MLLLSSLSKTTKLGLILATKKLCLRGKYFWAAVKNMIKSSDWERAAELTVHSRDESFCYCRDVQARSKIENISKAVIGLDTSGLHLTLRRNLLHLLQGSSDIPQVVYHNCVFLSNALYLTHISLLHTLALPGLLLQAASPVRSWQANDHNIDSQ